MKEDYEWLKDVLWASIRAIVGTFIVIGGVGLLILLCGCNRGLRKEIEQLREELARQQQYVPLHRDTIRDSVEVITQKIVEVEHVKEVLTEEDKELIKDLGSRVKDLEAYQKLGTRTEAEVTLASNDSSDSKSERDSVFVYSDAWLDLKYNTYSRGLLIRLQDSLAIAVEKEYKKKFLWWKWGTKGYQVKAVSFCPYTTIRYNTYVKRKR